MAEGMTLCLYGKHADAAAAAVKDRLASYGRRAEIVDAQLAGRIGSPESRTAACEVLMRNGVVVLVTTETVHPPENGVRAHRIDVDDSWSMAVEHAFDIAMHRIGSLQSRVQACVASEPMNRVGNAP
ncbi:MAG: hypothetical protein KJ060_01270 [Candidatus Hydrogenedentes bacterium]|nr:hypothetical protein [Candidatus Hydrogenedentota bacterium]